jgi:hypothetical protein
VALFDHNTMINMSMPLRMSHTPLLQLGLIQYGCTAGFMFKGARYDRCSRVQGMTDVQECKVLKMIKGARCERVNLILEAGVRSLGLEDAKELLPVVRTSW